MPLRSIYVTTSWDDGHPLDLRLAELLVKYDLPATFYIPLRSERCVVTPIQIRELSRYFEIGGHTMTHCDLTAIPREAARREIADCRIAIEEITGAPCTSFCFPMGRFRRSQLAEVKIAGFRAARTVELMSFAAVRVVDGLAVIPTTLQAFPAGYSTVARNSLKRLHPMMLIRYMRLKGNDWVATAAAAMEHIVDYGGAFHIWGHSWEIAELHEWGNLERLFKLLADYRASASFVNNGALVDAVRA